MKLWCCHHGRALSENLFDCLSRSGYPPDSTAFFAGYYDSETRERVERLFKCQHPIFGSAQPTQREALAAGMVAARSGIKKAAALFQ
jgi:hypothetical protein